jgi:hypothetical protein
MTTTIKKTTDRKGPGRPLKEIDLVMVEKLAHIHCTDQEIASIVGVSVETMTRRKRDDAEFAAMLEAARSRGKASLRRLQWKLAESGNAAVVIWLGKNLLGQRDKFDDAGTEDNKPLPWKD